MSQTLIILLPTGEQSPQAAVDWQLVDGDNQIRSQGSTALQDLGEHLSGGDDFDVVAIVPAETILSLRVQVPTAQLRQIRQALPFVVEEFIADDIENIHTAIPSTFRASLPDIDTVIVEHALLVTWLDLLHSHRLSPSALLVDALCLPRDQDGWSVVIGDDRVLVRSGRNRGLAMQSGDFEALFVPMLRAELERRSNQSMTSALQVHVMAAQSDNQAAESVKRYAGVLKRFFPDLAIKATLFKQDPAQLLSFDWQEQRQHGINLLQGGYATGQVSASGGGQWGVVAAVASVGVVVFLALALLSGWYFSHRAEQLQHQSLAVYRQLFPDQRRVVNPRRQLQNYLKLQGSPGNHSFLALLSETSRRIQNQASSPDVSLRQIRFNSDQGNLRFEVNSKSLDQLDDFKNLLAGAGLQVDINSASEQDGGVMGRIVVSQP